MGLWPTSWRVRRLLFSRRTANFPFALSNPTEHSHLNRRSFHNRRWSDNFHRKLRVNDPVWVVVCSVRHSDDTSRVTPQCLRIRSTWTYSRIFVEVNRSRCTSPLGE